MNTREPQANATKPLQAAFNPDRRRALKCLVGIGGLAAAVGPGAYAAEPTARGGRVSVRDYGAVGDGIKARYPRASGGH